jgi:hypothetical protein
VPKIDNLIKILCSVMYALEYLTFFSPYYLYALRDCYSFHIYKESLFFCNEVIVTRYTSPIWHEQILAKQNVVRGHVLYSMRHLRKGLDNMCVNVFLIA